MIPLIEDDRIVCPNCHQKVWKWLNECMHCNAPIRKLCPVCGEMEMIGTKSCNKPLREALSALEYFSLKIWMFRILGSMTACVFSVVGLVMNRHLKAEGFIVSEWFFILLHRPILLYLSLMVHGVYMTSPLSLSKKQRIRKAFGNKNPRFAKIFAKAEGEEK